MTPSPTPSPVHTPTPTGEADAVLYRTALEVLRAFQHQDGRTLAAYAAPEGVTFSPDIHVDPTDNTFPPEALPGLWHDPTRYVWGTEPGSGLPIELTFAEYAARYINDRDYSRAPQVAIDTRLGQGNTVDNLKAVWPSARFVEFHYPGTERYGGLDWSSLRLVFLNVEGEWRLRGVFHDAWTP